MLELKSVSWRNFMSYGNYLSTLDLSALGQCLITGEVIDSDTKDYDAANPIRRSNGAGKSTLPSVIQWVLFGRTMHSANPGSKIVNHFTGKDCWAKIEFKNGDSITRTRNLEGMNELIFVKDGDENILAANTLSTVSNQQRQLTKAFNLDWELFCGSVFFNQYSKPWMEMADQARKKAIERALHIDRFEYYARVAKTKLTNAEIDLENSNIKTQNIVADIERIVNSIERLRQSAASFDDNRQNRKKELRERIIVIQQEMQNIKLPDLEKLKGKWAIVAKINQKLQEHRGQSNKITSKIAESKGTKSSLESKIVRWTASSGKICNACEQEILNSHVASKVEPLQAELATCNERLTQLVAEHKQLMEVIQKTEQLVVEKQPSVSIRDAQSIHSAYEAKAAEVGRIERQIAHIDLEQNPHAKSIEEAEETLTKRQSQLEKIKKDNEEKTFLSQHYQYIYKAYNDRTKIKSYVFQEHIPFINERIKHYLGVFGLDVHIELTSSLGISSNLWGYEFESGGERKRTDVAFMLAMFDFHEQMYGRQCNILVLDEVDGRLDDDGIDSLINIIKDDLSSKVDSILLISHRESMYDVFSSQISVVKKDKFSIIESITR